MPLSCNCFESCCPPSKAPNVAIPNKATAPAAVVSDGSGLASSSAVPYSPSNIDIHVCPDLSGLTLSYSVPSAPSANDIALLNAPNGIMAAFEYAGKAADLQTKKMELLEVSKMAMAGGVGFLLKFKVTGTSEIIHVKCWSSEAGFVIITDDPLRGRDVNDPLVPFVSDD